MPANISMTPRIASRPSAGSSGMLWYTASSAKYAHHLVDVELLPRGAERAHQRVGISGLIGADWHG